MRYYFWNKETYEFEFSVEYTPDRTPSEGTTLKPTLKENFHTIWDKEQNTWKCLNPKEFTEHKIKLGLLTLSENQKVSEDGEIVEKTEIELVQEGKIDIETLRQRKISEVNMKAKQIIEGGFTSNALGENYVYDTTLEDQFNIKSLLDLGLPKAEIRCRKENESTKQYVLHTKEQIDKVVLDFANYKAKILRKAHEMKLELSEMNNVLAVYEYKVKF